MGGHSAVDTARFNELYQGSPLVTRASGKPHHARGQGQVQAHRFRSAVVAREPPRGNADLHLCVCLHLQGGAGPGRPQRSRRLCTVAALRPAALDVPGRNDQLRDELAHFQHGTDPEGALQPPGASAVERCGHRLQLRLCCRGSRSCWSRWCCSPCSARALH
jgi:hypothetical protein